MKNNPTIDIKSGSLFPWHFMLIAAIVLLAGLSLITERTLWSLILIALSGFVLSGYSGTEIDVDGKYLREYRSFFLVKSGKRMKFNSIEKIYINKSKTTQTVHTAHTNHSSVFSKVEYNAWLKLDDGRKIHLLSKSDKTRLIGMLREAFRSANVTVEDQTLPAYNP